MFYSIKSRVIVSFLGVALLVGIVSLIVGGQLLYDSVLNEARNRVRQDLNVARVIYDDRINALRLSLEITASAGEFRAALPERNVEILGRWLSHAARQVKFDFAGIVTADGEMLCRISPDCRIAGGTGGSNPVANLALKTRQPVAGTVVMTREQMLAENPELAQRATIRIQPSIISDDMPGGEETGGLAMGAAIPVFQNDELVGAVYGGILLNRDHGIVDKIGDTVFRNEIYKGHNVGTATIFFKDLRISTSVLQSEGQRAIGTRASGEVARRVLDEGEKWMDRAFVVNDWYITAYEALTDIFGQQVGMLYVGVLEAKYSDVRRSGMQVFTVITLAGVIVSVIIGWFLARRILRPVNHLIRASVEISQGNFSPEIGPVCKSDIGVLQKKFLKMTLALREREQRHKEERECSLIQSEKQASVGKLAAGVAHEINNPLTAVLTFTHLILRRKDISPEVRSDLETIAVQTERVRKIVKGLLDFSRQTRINPEAIHLGRLVEECVHLMRNQALIRGISLEFDRVDDLPTLLLDRNQFQSVVINMLINALDATEPGGEIHLEIRHSSYCDTDGVNIVVRDTGSGIAPENMDKLFDPFFTTKEVGKGTGLGLAVSAGIIERHGGRISVQSELGRGTTFTIWLPLEPDGLSCPWHHAV